MKKEENFRIMFYSVFIIILTSLQGVISIKYTNRPYMLQPHGYSRWLKIRTLSNMTSTICKDALLKLRISENIQYVYRGSLEYELGIISGGIVDKFTHILEIYKYYSKLKNFNNTEEDIKKLMTAYATIRSYYNQLIQDRNLYIKLEDKHEEKNEKQEEYWEKMAEKYNVSLEQLIDARDKGLIRPEDFPGVERPPERRRMKIEPIKRPKKNIKVPLKKETTKKAKKISWSRQNNTEEDQYKKALRYKNWAKKWRGFNPEIEGIHIPKPVADIGLGNRSEFLPKEIQGYV